MFFTSSRDSTTKTEKYLQSGHVEIRELLNQEDFSAAYRNQSPGIKQFFTEETSIMKLYDYIADISNKNDVKPILSLCQSTNTLLHRPFAERPKLVKKVFEILDKNDNVHRYTAGIFARIISRAIDLWPEEVCEVFRVAEVIPKIIENIDRICVWQTVSDLITDSNKYIPRLMWYFFIALSGDFAKERFVLRNPQEGQLIRPRSVYLLEDINIDFSKITEEHKKNIISLLITFCQVTEKSNSEIDMKRCFSMYLSTLKANDFCYFPALFDFALQLEPDEHIFNIANDLRKDKVLYPKPEKAILYIAYYIPKLTQYDIIYETVEDILSREESKTFSYQAILDVVQAFSLKFTPSEKPEENYDENILTEGKQKLQAIIKSVWNKRVVLPDDPTFDSKRKSRTIAPFLAEMATKCHMEETEDESWKAFETQVVEKWSENKGLDRTFKFE